MVIKGQHMNTKRKILNAVHHVANPSFIKHVYMAPSIDTRRKRESTPELAIDSTWDTWVKNKEGKRPVLCNRGGECGERRYSNSATITKKYEVSTPPRNQSLLFLSLLNQSNTILGLFFLMFWWEWFEVGRESLELFSCHFHFQAIMLLMQFLVVEVIDWGEICCFWICCSLSSNGAIVGKVEIFFFFWGGAGGLGVGGEGGWFLVKCLCCMLGVFWIIWYF